MCITVHTCSYQDYFSESNSDYHNDEVRHILGLSLTHLCESHWSIISEVASDYSYVYTSLQLTAGYQLQAAVTPTSISKLPVFMYTCAQAHCNSQIGTFLGRS